MGAAVDVPRTRAHPSLGGSEVAPLTMVGRMGLRFDCPTLYVSQRTIGHIAEANESYLWSHLVGACRLYHPRQARSYTRASVV